jgi:ABC-type protease/lipase transport system fused ATPase/permease subunit
VRAAAAAGADAFVRALPQGYETASATAAAALGRRAPPDRLARALPRDAPLVVLDEPTADLDP